jgi:hypothetical protein
MARTEWCVLVIGAGLLTACGATSAEPEPNPATAIAPPSDSSAPVDAGDWTMPTGVFRAVTPKEGTLELHVEPGTFTVYEVLPDSVDLGYQAECVPDDASTVTCTGGDGVQLAFAWSGTDDELSFQLVAGGEQGDHDVWEPVPWIRVP